MEKDLHSVYNKDVKLICEGHKINDTKENDKDRKARIKNKVIRQDMKVHLISNFCKDFLPLFRSVILVSEQKESQVYKLHDRMVITLRSFL